MKFSRLKTEKAYHAAVMTAANWRSPKDLEVSISLDTHWNKSGAQTATLLFMNVKNRPQVEVTLKQIAQNQTHDRWMAEIVAFARLGKTSYIMDTTPQPPLIIECSSYLEV